MTPPLLNICLQCSKTREEVQQPSNSRCETVVGYGHEEKPLDSWDRHHWRDWSDTELKDFGIDPKDWDKHRRETIYVLKWLGDMAAVERERLDIERI